MNDNIHYIDQYFGGKMPRWRQWANRSDIDGSNRVGAYVLGVFENPPGTEEGILSERVVYIGQAHGRTSSLRNRWNQFENNVKGRAACHCAAPCFREHGYRLENAWLMAFPVPDTLDEVGASCLAQLFERELIWHYYGGNGRRPVCNNE